jgi:hypothetical protein
MRRRHDRGDVVQPRDRRTRQGASGPGGRCLRWADRARGRSLRPSITACSTAAKAAAVQWTEHSGRPQAYTGRRSMHLLAEATVAGNRRRLAPNRLLIDDVSRGTSGLVLGDGRRIRRRGRSSSRPVPFSAPSSISGMDLHRTGGRVNEAVGDRAGGAVARARSADRAAQDRDATPPRRPYDRLGAASIGSPRMRRAGPSRR